MARKLRIEYPGARYHVFNRGNYRGYIFREAGARQAFLKCLMETCQRCGWVLHAYVIMGNHYHFAVETPQGNLVEGMKWLQATFANRFNRFRKERGHVFQGRYHAKLLEDEFALAAVAHYIHLNPVEAGLVKLETLGEFQDSSYWVLQNKAARPACLNVEAFLTQAGKLADTPAGHRSYADYLAFVSSDSAEQRRLCFDKACKGWAQGSKEWKRSLIAQHQDQVLAAGHSEKGSNEARELVWESLLGRCLAKLGRREGDGPQEAKSAPWKVAIAAHLKAIISIRNAWLATRLHMGATAGVSRYVSELHAGERPEARACYEQISKITV